MGRPARPRREAHGSETRDREGLTIRCAVEYDGTDYCGFQRQPNQRTVAGELEAAISALLGEPIALTSAGRTDTGVHACGQVVSFTTARIAFPWDRFALALHTRLPRDIRVRDVATVAPDFSARFSALRRRYIYAILARPLPSALLARYAWHLYRPLDIAAMRAAALPLVGEHDFRSFCGTLPENGNTVRRIESLTIEPRGELTIVRVAANAFLHRMVRTIVGLLAECAMGRRSPESVAAILAARDRAAAGVTAPAYGLYFAGVAYPDGYDSFAEPPIVGIVTRSRAN